MHECLHQNYFPNIIVTTRQISNINLQQNIDADHLHLKLKRFMLFCVYEKLLKLLKKLNVVSIYWTF